MTDCKRLVALKRLTDYLQTEVTVANGYQHDLSPVDADTPRVYRGREDFDDNDPLPCVSLLENMDPDRYPPSAGTGRQQHSEQLNRWVILVQGWVEDDKLNPTDPAYNLQADVIKALARITQGGDPRQARPADHDTVYMLGGMLDNFVVEPGVVRPPTEQVSNKAFFWLRVTLTMPEDPNDPYKL